MDTENLVVDAALQAFVNGNTEPIKGILRQTSRADYDAPKRFRFPTVEDCIFRTPAVCLLPKMNAARPRNFSPFEWEDNYAVLGNILLHAAACLPDHELARVLLEKGADVNSTNNQGLTALHTAVIQSDYELVRLLVENGADVRREGMDGETCLHLASKKSPGRKDSHYLDYKIIRLLIEKGADVNRADTSGQTALHLASEKSSGLKNSHYLDYEIIRLLLEKGADVNRADRRGQTALHIACLSRPSGVNSLDRKIIRLLLEKGADVTKADRNGTTALHIASERSSVILEMLTFKSPASVLNLGDFYGDTPFDYACGTQSPEIVQLLLSRGSSVVAKGRCRPLFHAVNFSDAKYVMPIASMLLKAGAKIAPDLLITAVKRADMELRAGENFPRLATHYPTFLELCTMLIDHGCDINAVDNWVRQTALHIAVRTKQELLVRKLLISRNIDIDKRDSKGYTPLRSACEKGCWRLVDLLLISGASLRGQDWETVFETWRSKTTLNEKYKNLYNYIIDSSKKCSTLENLCYICIRKNIRNVEKDAIKLGLSPLLVKRLQLKE